jgi:alkanesulfonate monooxygenase SsuD/methylene tetrahydromethanopterin reductase-like flavin-dependent oxidoreductase (luciferase family)
MGRWADDVEALKPKIAHWEQLGVAGVLYTDHLFISDGARRAPHGDPFVLASTVAALSEHLAVGTIVANVGLEHPALVLRHFVELARLHGGDRVLAGIGAGWNTEEFDSLGLAMAPYDARAHRLRSAAALARQLFDAGEASLDGGGFSVDRLPAMAMPNGPPRLLLGGGSDALLEVAGRYADQLDLNGSSRGRPLPRVDPRHVDGARRLATTIEQLDGSVERVRTAARAAGRAADAVAISVLLGWVEPCATNDIPAVAARLAVDVGGAEVALESCPYAVVGPPDAMAAQLRERSERFGLSSVIVPEGPAVELLATDVLPRLT